MLRIIAGLCIFSTVLAAVNPQVEFKNRLADYLTLRTKLAKEVPPLPERATPEQMAAHQDALAARIRESRTNVKQGNVFTPQVSLWFKSELQASVKGAVREAMKDESLDLRRNTEGEAPPKVPLKVNAKYPEATPVAAVPLQVLERLPKLPDGLEYRYVGSDFLLLDTVANLIIDYAPNIVPAL